VNASLPILHFRFDVANTIVSVDLDSRVIDLPDRVLTEICMVGAA
jgi:hypothetical protein